jgi:regulator of CtrA degradation
MIHQTTGAFAPSWRAEVILDFARSELFERTFHEGMELVDQTAAYLDGEGRQESKLLTRNEALAYAAESMRLTTRLMQMASWLLVQRAVSEGDMRPESASEDRYRLQGQNVRVTPSRSELPTKLALLSEQVERIYERVRHLDKRMYVDGAAMPAPANEVLSHIDRLRAAFG